MANPGLTDEQIRQAFDYLNKYGSKQDAADALGISRGAFQNRIRVGISRGYSPDHDMNHISPEGFGVKGVSTLYGPDGDVKAQWVKTTRDARRAQEAIEAAIEAFKDDLPQAEAVLPPSCDFDNLLTCYPVGDHHFGMLAWHEETGDADYDIKIAENLLCKAMTYLVDKSAATEDAAILVLGDFLHYDSMVPETPASRHKLDADSRFPQVVRAAQRSVRFMINEALKKHRNVRLILEIGNHDPSSTILLMESFFMFYENEPRIEVDRSPRNVHVIEYGKNMIATHHGDKIKFDLLGQIMANDWPEMWGRTKHRYVHTGHVHNDQMKKTLIGVKAESHAILAPKDAYAAERHWRSDRNMKAIQYHKEYGEQGRVIATPEMFL